MNSSIKYLPLTGFALLAASVSQTASAFPVDPGKVPVRGVDLSQLKTSYTLAYDSADKTVVYYSPKTGRIALYNGMPQIGFARIPGGKGYLNAQFQFEISSEDRQKLLGAIKAAGYTPLPLPYIKTKVMPMFQGYDPQTGKLVCKSDTDLSTGAAINACDNSLYDQLTYLQSGPTMGENIAVSAELSPAGAAIYSNLLRGGNAFQVALQADYYAAGDAFTATVVVDYSKLYEAFSVAANVNYGFYSGEIDATWKREGLCAGKSPDQCSIRVFLKDGRGRAIDNITVDPDNKDADLVWQAVERLKQQMQDQMMEPIAPVYGTATANTGLGWHLKASYEHIVHEGHAQFEYKSERGVNTKSTTIVATAACVSVSDTGVVTKETAGACQDYWSGGADMTDVLNRLALGQH